MCAALRSVFQHEWTDFSYHGSECYPLWSFVFLQWTLDGDDWTLMTLSCPPPLRIDYRPWKFFDCACEYSSLHQQQMGGCPLEVL